MEDQQWHGKEDGLKEHYLFGLLPQQVESLLSSF
jgi:hypothetical protein